MRIRSVWGDWVDQECDRTRLAGQWRTIGEVEGSGPNMTVIERGEHRRVVSFASNDYLGLTTHPAVVAAAHDALDRWGTGAGAARLVSGSRSVHGELESALADWKRTERALLFPTGYAANLGVIGALAGPGTRILSDELNHASIIDGCRLARASGAEVVVYPHCDLDAVDALLRTTSQTHGRTLVVTETAFSMDGGSVALDDLAALCNERNALMVLDEAHAVLGPEHRGDGGDVVRIGTLSKALASQGGFVAGPAPLVELIANRARSFIFTTAPAPANAAAALAALQVVRSPEGTALCSRLRRHVDRLAPNHPSPIVAVILGDETAALDASARLLDLGLLVAAIRPPTVAPGTSRLRVTLSAAHSGANVDRLLAALRQLPQVMGRAT